MFFQSLGSSDVVCQHLNFAYGRKVFASVLARLALQLWCAKICFLLIFARFSQDLSLACLFSSGAPKSDFAYVRKVLSSFRLIKNLPKTHEVK